MTEIIRSINPYINGGVSAGENFTQTRVREAILANKPTGEYEEIGEGIYMADTYGGVGPVSVESAAFRTIDIQEGLDKQIEWENMNVDDPIVNDNHGLPPCKRVGLND